MTTSTGGAGGAGGLAGGAGGTTGGTTGSAGSGIAGAAGGAGGVAAQCADDPGSGGAAGAPASGCDVDVARQALVALGIGTTGDVRTSTVTLPAALTDAQWGVKKEVCAQGGYDLSPVAGTTVCLVSQVSTRVCQANPARVWVLMANGAVACVYLALCPGSRIAPGVYSPVDPLCTA